MQPSQNETGSTNTTESPRDTSPFVAQVLGQILDATSRANIAFAYGQSLPTRTCYLYDASF
jgi:hypothetical protein